MKTHPSCFQCWMNHWKSKYRTKWILYQNSRRLYHDWRTAQKETGAIFLKEVSNPSWKTMDEFWCMKRSLIACMDLFEIIFKVVLLNVYSNFCCNRVIDFLSYRTVLPCFFSKMEVVHELVNKLSSLDTTNRLLYHVPISWLSKVRDTMEFHRLKRPNSTRRHYSWTVQSQWA